MKGAALEDVIQHAEDVEDEVFALLELNPQLVRSREMLDAVGYLKMALESLKKVERSLGTSPPKASQNPDDKVVALRPH